MLAECQHAWNTLSFAEWSDANEAKLLPIVVQIGVAALRVFVVRKHKLKYNNQSGKLKILLGIVVEHIIIFMVSNIERIDNTIHIHKKWGEKNVKWKSVTITNNKNVTKTLSTCWDFYVMCAMCLSWKNVFFSKAFGAVVGAVVHCGWRLFHRWSNTSL